MNFTRMLDFVINRSGKNYRCKTAPVARRGATLYSNLNGTRTCVGKTAAQLLQLRADVRELIFEPLHRFGGFNRAAGNGRELDAFGDFGIESNAELAAARFEGVRGAFQFDLRTLLEGPAQRR